MSEIGSSGSWNGRQYTPREAAGEGAGRPDGPCAP